MKSNLTQQQYPLSSPQREIWFDQMLHPDVPLYNIGGYIQINGAIDPEVFEAAVQLLVQHHDALRTRLLASPNEFPQQTFLEKLPVTVPLCDFSGEADPHTSAVSWMEQQIVQPIELEEKALFRFALLSLADKRFYIWFVYHHLINDAWGISCINKSLGTIYSSLLQGETPTKISPSYCHFVEDDRLYIESSRFNKDLNYWKEKFQSLPEPLFSPRYASQFVDRTPPSERKSFWLNRSFYNRLLTLAKDKKSTLFHVILGALYVYFVRTTQREEFAIGLPMLNRSSAAFKNTAGLFTGICIAWFRFGVKLSFQQLLESISKTLKSDYRHQRLPISELNRAVGVQKTGRKQLFDIQLNYVKHKHDIEFGDFKAKEFALNHDHEQTPLFVSVWELQEHENVQVDFVYNLAYFTSADIEQFQSRFQLILEYVLNHADESIGTIPLLTEAERQQLRAWNQTQAEFPYDKTLVDLFQARVEQSPNSIALRLPSPSSERREDLQLSYYALNTKANQLARYLMTLGVGAESIVGVCVERSLEMVVAMLGVLKAGGAYLPLDPEYPRERLRFMLEDSSAAVLLSQSHLQESLPASKAKIVYLDRDRELIESFSGANSDRQSGPDNLAYLIYTSGSTGDPKGVMNLQRGLYNRLMWMQETYKLTASDKVLHKTTICFDVSVWEIFWPLIAGARLIIARPGGQRESNYLVDLIEGEQITIVHFVPSMLQIFLQEPKLHSVKSLSRVICSGEALTAELQERFFARLPEVELHNLYGPTEASVDVTYWACKRNNSTETVPIGRPIANTRIHIVDAQHRLTAPGIPGELCIGGVGVARGYLNRPELTARKFVEIELSGQSQRVYKSGDLARWLPDGSLEFLGRLDHQVKMRGFRIELSEIEVTLAKHEAVKEAVVVLHGKHENPRLVAYLCLALAIDDVAGELRAWLKSRLPDYMLPSFFTVLNKLPLTPNGKIDRRALPDPDLSIQGLRQVARTESERLLCQIWSEVLELEIRSVRSNFFESGGHSLLAIQLLFRIRERLGVEMPLSLVFEQPLLVDQAEWLDKQQRGSGLPPIRPLAEDEALELSFAQQRLWFLSQLDGQNATYNMAAALRLSGELNKSALRRALKMLIQRHESLRICFPASGGEPTIQRCEVYDPLSVTDLSDLSLGEQQEQVAEWISRHAQSPFDLSTGPLLRLRLLKLGDREQVLLFNMHHIISDGWSVSVLLREWSQLYNAYVHDQKPALARLPIQYSDYASWQRGWLSGEVLESQLSYWRRKLAGAPQLLELPTDYPRPAVMRYQGGHVQSILDTDIARGVKQLSRQQGGTVFMTLLAAFKLLLSRYSGQSDLVVGSPIANRTHHQVENLIGFFVNTLVLRSQLDGMQTFPEVLRQVRDTAIEAYSHQDIPFEYLVEQLNPTRSLSHSPLFQVMFVLQNVSEEELDLSGLSVSLFEPENKTSKFDLNLSISDKDEKFVCTWEYRTDLFRPETITRMSQHFQVLLEGILAKPEQALAEISLLSKAEGRQLLAWNQTRDRYPANQTLVDLFQTQVEKTPENIAVVCEGQQLSYRELNARTNQLAHYLKTLGVDAEDLVGICVERSLEMVIGLLGIVKAGGAYLPLDPDSPVSRLQFMVEDSSVAILLSQSHLLDRLTESNANIICLDSEWEQIATASAENPERRSGPESLAYVNYTSGSTGRPKGVMIQHNALVNVLTYMRRKLDLRSTDKLLAVTTLTFDIAALELFLPLISGSRTIIASRENSRNAGELAQKLAEHQITLMQATPSTWAALVQSGWRQFENLTILCGGEALPRKLGQSLLKNSRQVWNVYGPTETTIWSSIHDVNRNPEHPERLGMPIANTQIYVLDAYHKPSLPGIPGELYIGGAGLARGYLKRPKLTAEKFIELDIFGISQRVFKTGDLARWLPDGSLEYLGRTDHQIKLRGFRIELPEIESVLSQHQHVNEAVVVLSTHDDNPRLVSYVTLAVPLEEVTVELRAWLKSQLPEYMVPASFTVVDSLPLTPNGKIDRKALPEPDLTIHAPRQIPRTETERLLCQIWSQVLGSEVTSILSNFFEAGGHSLLATRLVSRIRQSLGIEMPLQLVFEQPLLREQAEWLEQQERGSALPLIEPMAEGKPLELSFAQQRLWFLAQLDDQSAAYNVPAALGLSGNLNVSALQHALTALILRHENLRLCFPSSGGKPTVQLTEVYDSLSISDLSNLSANEQRNQLAVLLESNSQTPFDLSAGPLLRLRLIKLGAQEQVLLFNIHHIISDGWSLNVLMRELSQLYNAFAENREPALAELPIQYSDYASWQRSWLEGEVLEKQVAYWREKLHGAPQLLELPTDYPRPAVMRYAGKRVQSVLDEELTRSIKSLSQQHEVTVFMTLLAAFKVLLSRYSRQKDLVVGSPIANRSHHQIEDLIGFFANTLVLRSRLEEIHTFPELLQQLRQTALEAYSHQDVPFEQLVEILNPARSLSHAPLFQVMFVLQNVSEESLELSGLNASFLEQENTTAKFDLSLSVAEKDDVFVCDWEYRADLFRPETITRMTENFQHLLEVILAKPSQALSRMPLLTEKDHRQLQTWNKTENGYPGDLTIVDLFQRQVEQTPNAIALQDDDRQLSYRELNLKANQMAQYLIAMGVEAETVVGICVERSPEMLIALLGILKAGGSYVALDPDYPPARLRYIVEDSSARILLSQSHLLERLPTSSAKVLCLDCDRASIAAGSGENPARRSGPDNLLYVMYTSGSTGRPKGVAMPHSALFNLIRWQIDTAGFRSAARTLQFTSLNFDVSCQEIFGTWSTGGTLVLISEDTRRDPRALLNFLYQHQVERLFVPLVALEQLAGVSDQSEPLFLKEVVTAGEQLKVTDALARFFDKHPGCSLHNHYGPTESHVATSHELPRDPADWSALPPIGGPIANTQIYILDADHNLCPPGLPGELCIGGAGLARGYINRPDLTAEKFVELEISGKSQRIYKTGDLARWLADGNLEFLGRLDNQVKLRGFRIELGEIEATLRRHEAVSEAVVLLYDQQDNPRLVAYISLTMPLDDVTTTLRSWLKVRLPEYMLPAGVTVLDTFPLTPNGKINRKALPAPDLSIQIKQQAPASETERLLCKLWTEVLGSEVTSIQSDFFEAGGHSLLATRLVSRIHDSFGVEMPLRVVFEESQLQGQAAWLDAQHQNKEQTSTIAPERDESLVLSFAQQRLWFLAQLEGQSATYNISAAARLSGRLNEAAMQRAFTALVQRHESLRLRFPAIGGEATVQRGELYNPLSVTDLSALSAREQKVRVAEWIVRHAQSSFDLSTGPLLRLRLLKLGAQEHVLLFNMHHIISDGWSMGVLVRDWSQLYSAYAENRKPDLPELPIQYTEFASWQRSWLEGEVLEQQLAFWRAKLAGMPQLLELPTDYPRPAVMRYQGSHFRMTLEPDLSRGIKQFSRRHRVTVFASLLAAFKVLLFRYSGQRDLIVGSPIANRTHRQTENLIGFFVNTLVFRTQLSGSESFAAVLQRMWQSALEAFDHQDIPFEYLVEKLNPSRSLSHSPLFQVMFVLQNAPKESLDLGGLKVSLLEAENTTSKFDLTLSITEDAEEFVCDWEYRTDLFRPETISRMTEHFRVLLKGILENPERPLSELPILSKAEQQQLLAWNKTASEVPPDLTIVDLFQAQVEKSPDSIALLLPATGSQSEVEQKLTYRDLNTKANQLAHYLMSQGVRAESPVGICAERSLEMVIALLGILKAGGAYVPLDPDLPPARLRYLLEDSSVSLLLSQSHLLEHLPDSNTKVICLDSALERAAGLSQENPARQCGPENLAYLIYTSGSTGLPKGVCITQQAVVRLVHQTDYARLDEKQTFLQYAPVSFDAATLELWGALLNGARLVVMPPRKRSLTQLSEVLREQKVSTLWLTSSLFNLMLDEQPEGLRGLKQLLVGGEELSQSHVQRALKLLPETQLINGYGPTENTTFTCCYPIERKDYPASIPIGKPIAHTSVYILDSYGQPVPIGVAGQLYTGGLGLARAYLNRPDLSAERFVKIEVFGKSQRLYKTGDLARWLPDGNIEFLGRSDHQVKLRGFRIELGEIEVTLSRHEAMNEAVVMLYHQQDDPRLIAYVTLNRPFDAVAGVLRSWLKSQLPEYMVPAGFVVLETMPLTPSGKIDRKALPAPDLSTVTEHGTAGTETEHLLCNLWSRVLGTEITSVRSDFFEVGGHSLLATRLVSRIRESFGIEMPLQLVFEHSILKEQAQWLDTQQRGSELPPIRSLAADEPLVLSFAQQRLWFLAQLEGQSATYNIPAALHLKGRMNEQAMQGSLKALIQRHDSLRLRFPAVGGEASVLRGEVYDPLSITDLSAMSASEQEEKLAEWIAGHAQNPFDLSNGPLLRLRLLKLGAEEHVLLFNMHHIISDGWSMGVLIRDWSHLYNAYAAKREPALPDLPIQYTDYASWQRSWLEGAVLERQLAYWREKLAGAPQLLELPTDFPRPAVMRYRGKHFQCALDATISEGIKRLSRQEGATVYMTLLAAFKVLLSRYSGQTDLVVGSPIANRTHHQSENMIGLFVNTLVLRSELSRQQTFSELLQQVRQTALEAYSHQDIPFEFLVEQVNPSRSLSHTPLFQVMFVLQNNAEESLELSGLEVSYPAPDTTTAKFDLTLSIAESDGGFVCDWEYCTDLFRPATIARMTEHFRLLLEGIVENPEQASSRIALLTEAEQQQLLAWNQTESDFPKDVTIVDLFQEQAEQRPDSIAVLCASPGSGRREELELSYQALNMKANQLAHYLMSLGVGAETIVGVCVERSLEMVIALLGILKAGGAYVPLDPDYPRERLRFMLEDSSAPILLSQSNLLERLPASSANVICLDSDWEQIAEYSGANPERQSGPDNPAYVIYTSGSTGLPKGAVNLHRGIYNRLLWMQAMYRLTAADNVLQKTTFCFDVSVWEIFWPLLTGARLSLAKPGGQKESDYLIKVIGEEQITTLHFVPSVLQIFLEDPNLNNIKSLKRVICSGEALSPEVQERFFDSLPAVELHNLYGPTEAAIDVTYWKCQRDYQGDTVPIGRPIANTQIHILDTNDNPLPIGVPGELCIAGAGLARGYLNRPEQSSEKFVDTEVFAKVQRLYKTGDLARWLPEGWLEYRGRIDNQVKIRGFRVELGEIEACLLSNSHVKEAVVIARGQNESKALTAYIVVDGTLNAEELREYVKTRLPDYMLPAYFVQIDELPLLPNGKIDRNGLAALQATLSTREFRAPQNDLESDLLSIWQQFIHAEGISTNANFFDVGGNSLSLVKAHWEIVKKYPGVTLMDLFANPNIAELAQFISRQNEQSRVQIEPLLLDQKFFSSERESGLLEYSLDRQLVTRLKEYGKREKLEIQDILRTSFAYLLYEISNQSTIQYYATSKDDQVISISHNYDDISSIKELLHASRRQFLNPEATHPADEFMKSGANPGSNGVLPLYSNPTNKEFENTDLHLQTDAQNGTVDLALSFSSRMNKEEMRQLPGLFVVILEETIKETMD